MPKPARPYSDYNLFFQLEREFILQVDLGFQPNYDPSEIFDPFDTINYQGPPLPSKYRNLIYLNDWHLPGKAKRRRRRHRRSHGMIGFHELSLRIAASWKNVDTETRTFCAQLGNMGLRRYKSDLRAYEFLKLRRKTAKSSKVGKKSNGKKNRATLKKIVVHDVDEAAGLVSPSEFHQGVSTHHLGFLSTERCTKKGIGAIQGWPELVHHPPPLQNFVSDVTEYDSPSPGVDLNDDVMIGELSSGLGFVPTEKFAMEDVDAAFDKDTFQILPDLIKLCPVRRCVSDITESFDEHRHSVVDLDHRLLIENKSEHDDESSNVTTSALSFNEKWIDDLFVAFEQGGNSCSLYNV
ncbi:hypothetical protein ACHAW6_008130 [Cyclotella cf. meneghiniana]